MSFLKLVDKKVVCTEEGMTLFEVKRVYSRDKTDAKKEFFHAVITAIYYLFKPRGLYWNKPLQERIKIVDKDHLKTHKWNKLLESNGVQELADKYIELCQTVNEQLEEGFKEDVYALLKMMKDVPMNIEYKIEKGTEVLNEDGDLVKTKVEKIIIIPNIEEKKKMIDMGIALSKALKDVQANLKEEADEREKLEAETRIYDERNSSKE